MKHLTMISLLSISINSYAEQLLNNEQQLGKRLFSDNNLSLNRNQACASCHSLTPVRAQSLLTKRVPGFVDPDNVRSGSAVSDGSIPGFTGSLNAPSAGYAAYSPEFHWDDEDGFYIGGQFWNGRASNLSEQAKMPFLNPVEMAMPNELAVISRLKPDKTYQRLFREIYGLNLNEVTNASKSNANQSEKIARVFQAVVNAISEYEKSPVFNKFNSKFDYVLAGQTTFTPLEAKGFELFNREDKGNCAACHVSEESIAEDGRIEPPLFTDFSYDNIGLPRNINIPGNPEPDLGLGNRTGDPDKMEPDELGKHKVMSLRNIALTSPYGHNGSMATLEQIMHFYNTRDTLGYVDDINHPGFATTGWPEPEVSNNLNQDELGSLGLSDEEEKAIVAFMKTLTDDYPQWGHDRRVPPWSISPFAQSEKPAKGKSFKARINRIMNKRRR